jgi:transcriptional regulator with XRE-family HTH domain
MQLGGDMKTEEHVLRDLGSTIRTARTAATLTQAELGTFIGADRFAVAALENGLATTQVRRLIKLLDVIGLELSVTPRSRRLAYSEDEQKTSILISNG